MPFPSYEFTVKPDIKKIQQLSSIWDSPSLFCPLIFLNQTATNNSGFNVIWMLHQIDHEIFLAQQNLVLIRNETAMCFTPPKLLKSTRHRRTARMGLADLAAVGLFGGGLAAGGSDSCGLRGLFGNCQGQSRQMQKMYAALLTFKTHYLRNLWLTRMKTFFLLKMIWRPLTQYRLKWPQLKIRTGSSFESRWLIMNKMANRDQPLFANQQLNFNFKTVPSLFSVIHASVKRYRSPLFSFPMNLLFF